MTASTPMVRFSLLLQDLPQPVTPDDLVVRKRLGPVCEPGAQDGRFHIDLDGERRVDLSPGVSHFSPDMRQVPVHRRAESRRVDLQLLLQLVQGPADGSFQGLSQLFFEHLDDDEVICIDSGGVPLEVRLNPDIKADDEAAVLDLGDDPISVAEHGEADPPIVAPQRHDDEDSIDTLPG